MITIDSNMQSVVQRITNALMSIDADAMGKEMATTVHGMMRKRIHEDGKASDGSGIGTYSAGYMKVRTGVFGNSGRASRGKNKGKPKNAGTYVRGANKGKPRPNYHRTGSRDVILSLTREMENDFAAIRLDNGNWSIGFARNPKRGKNGGITHIGIARRAESKLYNKPIYSLSADERTAIDLIVARRVTEAFNGS
ncbi:MAG: hypothetical protein LBS43_12525 [Prevotellaceae bacterium]|jgi:hypothetical protein|nr:hypothetical protein [Prevotellaceae bacterium]